MNKSLILSLSFAAAQMTASAGVLLHQPLAFVNAWFSSTNTGETAGFQTWDRVALPVNASVNRISWTGAFMHGTSTPIDPIGDSWRIKLAYDSESQPGMVRSYEELPFASVASTFLGNSFIAGLPVKVFSFTADLTTPFQFNANENMWLTVYSSAPTTSPTFAWSSGGNGDGVGTQYFLSTMGYAARTDRALTLEGTETPEPATFWSIGIAGIALAAFRRRN